MAIPYRDETFCGTPPPKEENGMLGYECDQCGELIAQSEPGERRDCPHCSCPAEYTTPSYRSKENSKALGQGGE